MDYTGIIIPFVGGLGMFIYGMQIMACLLYTSNCSRQGRDDQKTGSACVRWE